MFGCFPASKGALVKDEKVKYGPGYPVGVLPL